MTLNLSKTKKDLATCDLHSTAWINGCFRASCTRNTPNSRSTGDRFYSSPALTYTVRDKVHDRLVTGGDIGESLSP
jgi:hypothetical protein